jgi:hypothetical protein
MRLKFGEAGQNTRNHAARGVRGVDAFAYRPQHDPPITEVPDGLHYFGRTAQ